jgi:hypothetical protein
LYLFRFCTVCVPVGVRHAVLSPDPRYPLRVYGYQEFFRLLQAQGALLIRNPVQRVAQLHVGEAAALALARDEGWWLLINAQRALTCARQQGIKAVTAPEFVVYLYEVRLLSWRSTQGTLDGLAAHTGQRLMPAARDTVVALAQQRGERCVRRPSKTPAPTPAKRVTTSMRLTPDEATDLAQLVSGTAYAEAALLRPWGLAGMQQFRVAEAIRAYQDGHMDIRHAAAQALLPPWRGKVHTV